MPDSDYSLDPPAEKSQGEIDMPEVETKRERLAGLTNHAVGIADLVSVALRDAATHLEALRFIATAYAAGDHTAVQAGLAPYTVGSEEDRYIGPAVLDDPLGALHGMIEVGTPEEIRVRLICDAVIDSYRAVDDDVAAGIVVDLREALVRS